MRCGLSVERSACNRPERTEAGGRSQCGGEGEVARVAMRVAMWHTSTRDAAHNEQLARMQGELEGQEEAGMEVAFSSEDAPEFITLEDEAAQELLAAQSCDHFHSITYLHQSNDFSQNFNFLHFSFKFAISLHNWASK